MVSFGNVGQQDFILEKVCSNHLGATNIKLMKIMKTMKKGLSFMQWLAVFSVVMFILITLEKSLN
jgi:hypothetical protein